MDYLIIASDAARARFFRLEPVRMPEVEGGPNLVEDRSLTNPESEMRGTEVFTSSKSGRNRGVARGASHVYDDHRSDHYEEFCRRFAHQVAIEGKRLAKHLGSRIIVLAADPRMLGLLRAELQGNIQKDSEIREFARDVSKLTPRQVHDHLAANGMVPARRLPTQRRR